MLRAIARYHRGHVVVESFTLHRLCRMQRAAAKVCDPGIDPQGRLQQSKICAFLQEIECLLEQANDLDREALPQDGRGLLLRQRVQPF